MDRSNLPPAVVEALRRGNKIEAIKLLRQSVGGLGLAEAKAFLDRLENAAGAAAAQGAAAKPRATAKVVHHAAPLPRRDGLSPGEEPRAGSNPMPVIGLIVLALLGIWLFSSYG
jgi:hypothetical protein